MNRTQKILTGILALTLVGLFFVAIMNHANRNIERFNASKTFQPSDFSEDKYEVTEVWQREITHQNASAFDQKYIFFKVKHYPFNFNFGAESTDYGKDNQTANSILTYLRPGAVVSILANKEDIRFASDNSLLRRASNFLAGLNDEVEVYKLSIDGQVYVNQDIRTPSFSNRSFADIATSKNLLRLGFFCCIIYGLIYWIPKLIRKKGPNTYH